MCTTLLRVYEDPWHCTYCSVSLFHCFNTFWWQIINNQERIIKQIYDHSNNNDNNNNNNNNDDDDDDDDDDDNDDDDDDDDFIIIITEKLRNPQKGKCKRDPRPMQTTALILNNLLFTLEENRIEFLEERIQLS